MTPQDKIFSLAELDGLKPKIVEGLLMAGDGAPIQNYLASYDAIIPLIQKQPDHIRQEFFYELMKVRGLPKLPCGELGVQINITHLQFANLLVSTPTQLADALLIATGKMKE